MRWTKPMQLAIVLAAALSVTACESTSPKGDPDFCARYQLYYFEPEDLAATPDRVVDFVYDYNCRTIRACPSLGIDPKICDAPKETKPQ